MTGKWPDLAGRIEGETHVLPVRVYFEDTDCAGVVYHANFLKFCERARSDFIRLLGIDARSLASPEQGEPAVFVVRRVEIDFETDSLADRLRAAGFRKGARTFVVWEGVSMYLTRAAVKATLTTIRAITASRSII